MKHLFISEKEPSEILSQVKIYLIFQGKKALQGTLERILSTDKRQKSIEKTSCF